jgi:8-amino-7-oxononanoate synthase
MKPDLFAKFDPLINQRAALLATGQRDPFSLVMESVLSPTRAICNGRETILLGTYNYMGMTFDDDVIRAGKAALDEFGAGTTGSRVLNGTYQGHRDGPCDGLFHRISGQSGDNLDHRGQG